MPVEIPGEWFKFFSKGLGSERHWLKYSYLWITSEDHRAPTPGFSLRRVISDPLGKGERAEVLLCEPNQPRKFIPPPVPRALRGAIIKWTEPDPGAAPTAIIRPRK
jgi:hypothetical protein